MAFAAMKFVRWEKGQSMTALGKGCWGVALLTALPLMHSATPMGQWLAAAMGSA